MPSKILGFLLITCLFMPSAWAFLTIGESGDLTPVGVFKLGVEPQFKLSDGSGGNMGVFVDSGLNDEWSWRAQLGTGDTDFWAGGSAKWIPVPDYNQQPAIGLRGEAVVGRDNSETITVFRIAPLISKGFDTDIGRVTPFAALPLGIYATKGNSDNTSELVIGSEGRFEGAEDFLFSAELGFNMSHSFSYISGTATYFFNESGAKTKTR